MVFYRSVPILIKVKMVHVRKIGGRLRRSFIVDFGDIPGARFNSTTGKIEKVVNNRGLAYACRNRLRYRRRKNI